MLNKQISDRSIICMYIYIYIYTVYTHVLHIGLYRYIPYNISYSRYIIYHCICIIYNHISSEFTYSYRIYHMSKKNYTTLSICSLCRHPVPKSIWGLAKLPSVQGQGEQSTFRTVPELHLVGRQQQVGAQGGQQNDAGTWPMGTHGDPWRPSMAWGNDMKQ